MAQPRKPATVPRIIDQGFWVQAFLLGCGPTNSAKEAAEIGENDAEINKNDGKRGPGRAEEGKVRPMGPGA